MTTLRLILGDQLNAGHSWFDRVDADVVYTLMELRQETDYVLHHAQKILGIFAAMRDFAEQLKRAGHRVDYLRIDDPENRQERVPVQCPVLGFPSAPCRSSGGQPASRHALSAAGQVLSASHYGTARTGG